jgi:hypothetical protein
MEAWREAPSSICFPFLQVKFISIVRFWASAMQCWGRGDGQMGKLLCVCGASGSTGGGRMGRSCPTKARTKWGAACPLGPRLVGSEILTRLPHLLTSVAPGRERRGEAQARDCQPLVSGVVLCSAGSAGSEKERTWEGT